ncbi:hypothetical protein OROHE_003575 [Orobanche hederae]
MRKEEKHQRGGFLNFPFQPADMVTRDLVFLLLHYFIKQGYVNAAGCYLCRWIWAGSESGFYFNMNFFGDAIANGELDLADIYVSVFTKFDDRKYSSKILFEIRKQKYLESLDKGDYEKAMQILSNDFESFCLDDDLYMELLGVVKSSDHCQERSVLLAELEVLIKANPFFQDKILFPLSSDNSDLQSLNDQEHQLCKYWKSGHNIKPNIVFLILQFLEENNFERASQWLGADSGQDYEKALEILRYNLSMFSTNDNFSKEMSLLWTLPNLRCQLKENHARSDLIRKLIKLVNANPLILDSLRFPSLEASSLQRLINQSLGCHSLPDLGIRILPVDHSCGQPYGDFSHFVSTTPLSACSTTASFGKLGVANSSVMSHQRVRGGPICLNSSEIIDSREYSKG